jgi:hypothetical protein
MEKATMADKHFEELMATAWQEAIDRNFPQHNTPMLNRAQMKSLSGIVAEIGGKTPRLFAYIVSEWRGFARKVNDAGTPEWHLPPIPSLTFLHDHLEIAIRMAGDRHVSLDDEGEEAA